MRCIACISIKDTTSHNDSWALVKIRYKKKKGGRCPQAMMVIYTYTLSFKEKIPPTRGPLLISGQMIAANKQSFIKLSARNADWKKQNKHKHFISNISHPDSEAYIWLQLQKYRLTLSLHNSVCRPTISLHRAVSCYSSNQYITLHIIVVQPWQRQNDKKSFLKHINS